MKTEFKDKSELFEYLRANKTKLIAEKKAVIKFADACSSCLFGISDDGKEVTKSIANPELLKLDSFKVAVAINTTNIMDSHRDVHIPGLWDNSLKDNPNPYLLEKHNQDFKAVISDNVTATAKMMNWSELGKNYPGMTQVLLFNADIPTDMNPYMAEQYAKGRVKNHSVGMQYVQLSLAMNSDLKWDAEEKATWDIYISQVVNKDAAEAIGYFWVVTEAKMIEGSAVLFGSNNVTPTISIGKELPVEEKKKINFINIYSAIKNQIK